MKQILLVVLYKQTLSSSETVLSFCSGCVKYHNNVKLVIWDNSPDNDNDFGVLKDLGIEYEYIHTPENISLAVIYNNVVSKAFPDQLIHIFDQDTKITQSYFDLVYAAAEKESDVSLFIPYLLYNNRIMSPGRYKFYKGVYSSQLELGKILAKNILFIASGMTIKASVADKVKFDENLRLYGIDSKFSLDYSRCFKYLYVVNYSLTHSLSQFESEAYEIKIKRLKSTIAASRYIALKHSGIMAYMMCTAVAYVKLIVFKVGYLLSSKK